MEKKMNETFDDTLAGVTQSGLQNQSTEERFIADGWESHLELSEHLVQFSNVLLTVTGEKGCGKTTFIERLQGRLPKNCHTYILDGDATLSIAEIITVMQEAFHLPGFDRDVSETDQLRQICELLARKKQLAVLFIDDAHALSVETLTLLVNTIIRQSETKISLHCVLSGDPILQAHLPQDFADKDEVYHHIALNPLTSPHTEQLRGLQRSKPFVIGSLSLLALAVFFIGWFFQNAQRQVDLSPSLTKRVEMTPQILPIKQYNAGMRRVKQQITGKYQQIKGAVSSLLPQPEQAKPRVIAKRNGAAAQFVQHPTLVKHLAYNKSGMQDDGPTLEEKQSAWEAQAQAYQREAHETAVVDKVIVLPQLKVAELVKQKKNKRHSNTTTKPSQFYTIQLVGSHKQMAVKSFINDHGIESKAKYLNFQLKGKPWYVVVYGRYTTHQQALEAINTLNQDLKRLKPWVRKIS